MNNLSLGQKIKKYRLRAGKSQLDLELETGLSTGTISRIESDTINPTKETLIRLIEVLNLSGIESASLFNISLTSIPKLINLTRDITNESNLQIILQRSVQEISNELNLHGTLIALKDENILRAMSITKAWYVDLMLELIGKPLLGLTLEISETPQNLFVRAMQDRKPHMSNDLYDFSAGTFPKYLTPIVQRVTKHGSGIVFPLLDDNSAIGGILFTKSYIDDFNSEYEILESFSDAVAKAIIKARNY